MGTLPRTRRWAFPEVSLQAAPWTQTLAGLVLPQPPQLFGSLVGFTQTPLHSISGLGQLATQEKPLQTSPIVGSCPPA